MAKAPRSWLVAPRARYVRGPDQQLPSHNHTAGAIESQRQTQVEWKRPVEAQCEGTTHPFFSQSPYNETQDLTSESESLRGVQEDRGIRGWTDRRELVHVLWFPAFFFLLTLSIPSWPSSLYLPPGDGLALLNRLFWGLAIQRKGAGEDHKGHGGKSWWGGLGTLLEGKLVRRWQSFFSVKGNRWKRKGDVKDTWLWSHPLPCRVQKRQVKGWDLWKLLLNAGLYYFNKQCSETAPGEHRL